MRPVIILILIGVITSCNVKKDLTEEKSIELTETYIQRVIPGAEEETPHYRIVYTLPKESVVKSIDSAYYNHKMHSIYSNGKSAFQMKVKEGQKHLPFKLYYTIGDNSYYSKITEVTTKEADLRP
jgi:hypothetical protein